MKRLIALLIAILALIACAGRTEVTVTTDCTPVSAEITEKVLGRLMEMEK